MELVVLFMFLNRPKIAVVLNYTFNSMLFTIQNSLSDSVVVRDDIDGTKMNEQLLHHFLFPENPDFYYINTGVLVYRVMEINCHKPFESGIKDINRIVFDFETVKFKRADRLKPSVVMISIMQVDR